VDIVDWLYVLVAPQRCSMARLYFIYFVHYLIMRNSVGEMLLEYLSKGSGYRTVKTFSLFCSYGTVNAAK